MSTSLLEMEQLAGMLAHEIRNPLASATTNLAVAADLTEESDPRTPFLRRAEGEMERINVLLTACLELACAGRVHARRVCLSEMFELVAARLESRAENVEFEFHVSPGLEFDLDPDLIMRVIENLCENAIRAIGDSRATIKIEAELRSECLQLSVEDSGPGLPPELASRIFEPFVSGSRGSGLGLAFVRLVAKAHGGLARTTESRLGGARFEICLPTDPRPEEEDSGTPTGRR